jgi:hypothetical protein
MSYLNKAMTKQVLQEMQKFEGVLNVIFQLHGLDLRENTGRRNALISKSQEKETAKVLRQYFTEVIEDGSPGKPDIFIKDIETELECKLTSGSRSKNSVSYSLQTDYATLEKKGSLDYVFVLSNTEFDKFCVLFFEGLTIDDYFEPANGSRGKSRMKKYSAMKKVTVLHGDYDIVNEVRITNLNKKIAEILNEKSARISELTTRLKSCSRLAIKERENIVSIIKNEDNRYDKQIEKLKEKIKVWDEKNNAYSFKLKEL